MSKPFKMKGWSGYQKPSAIRQEIKTDHLTESLKKAQEKISNIFKGLGVRPTIGTGPGQVTQEQYTETYGEKLSGLGLTNKEKEAAKKFGMSEWQWKRDVNKSGTRVNRYAKDKKIGKYAVEETSDETTPPVTTTDKTITDETKTDETKTDVGSADEGGWVTRKNDPWSYRKTDKGYQTKKGEDGTIIDVVDKNTTAYQSIASKVFNEGEKPVEEEIITQPPPPEEKTEVDEETLADFYRKSLLSYAEKNPLSDEALAKLLTETKVKTKKDKKKKKKKKKKEIIDSYGVKHHVLPQYIKDAGITYEQYIKNPGFYDRSLDKNNPFYGGE